MNTGRKKPKHVYDLEIEDNHNYFADGILVSNCHGTRADTWTSIANYANPQYCHGFSATPINVDTLDNIGDATIYGIYGGIIYTVSDKYLVEVGLNAECVVSFKKTPGRGNFYPANFKKLYNKDIIHNTVRNNSIIADARLAVKYGFRTVISVQEHEHAKLLMTQLKDLRVICKFGGNQSLQFDDTGAIIDVPISLTTLKQKFANGDYDILIGSPAMGQGIDIPSIGFMIIAGGYKARTLVVQRRGRGSRRKTVGPNRFYLRDYWDMAHVFLKSHSMQRKALYEEAESTIIEDEFAFWNMVYHHGQELLNN